MENKQLYLRSFPTLLALTVLFFLGTFASAQSYSAQGGSPAQDNKSVQDRDRDNDNKAVQDNDTTRRELAQFDQFLDTHREIAEQLRKDPSLVNNKDFVKDHPALQTYLQEQPAVREELKENPTAFMRQENNFDRREDTRDRDARPEQLAQFDRFLDGHREIAEQLRKDPSLVNNKDFVKNHPALQAYLQEQPGIRDQLRDNPTAFMRQEDNFDRREDTRDRDTRPEQLAQFDRFLDGHREIAEQLRKDPSLANNKDFLKDHPALQAYLQEQPGVRDQLRDNPTAFMRQENNFDRHEDTRDRGVDREQLARFGRFLDSHHEIAEDLRRDPSLVRSHEYVQKHAELQECLKANPGVQDQFTKNPEAVFQSTKFGNSTGQPSKAPTFDSKPKP